MGHGWVQKPKGAREKSRARRRAVLTTVTQKGTVLWGVTGYTPLAMKQRIGHHHGPCEVARAARLTERHVPRRPSTPTDPHKLFSGALGAAARPPVALPREVAAIERSLAARALEAPSEYTVAIASAASHSKCGHSHSEHNSRTRSTSRGPFIVSANIVSTVSKQAPRVVLVVRRPDVLAANGLAARAARLRLWGGHAAEVERRAVVLCECLRRAKRRAAARTLEAAVVPAPP